MQSNKVYQLTVTALLVAIGILIPMISPVKIILEPASFTLASHVPIFIAMFLSPSIAAWVALGTTAGFMFAGFPLVISLRAFTHVLFALAGAYLLKKKPSILESVAQSQIFSFLIGLLHAAAEVAVVSAFFFSGSMGGQSFLQSVFLLVGIGTVIHSMVDFAIAQLIWKVLYNRTNLAKKMPALRK